METEILAITTEQASEIIANQQLLLQRLERFDLLVDGVLQLNGYLYLIVFLVIGVGMFYLFYRFLKIFL